MSLTTTASVSATIAALQTNALNLCTTYLGNPSTTYTNAFASGVSKVYFATLNTTMGYPSSLDLSNGSLSDAFGTALTFTSLKAIYIYNKDSTNTITVFGGSTPVIANTLDITAGGNILLTSTFAVSGSTKLMQLDPGSHNITVDIFLLGA